MSKFYFKYGTVSSGKTLQLLVTANNYERQGKKVLFLKPEIDTRFGYAVIRTRIGLEKQADILLPKEPHVIHVPKDTSCIVVDEVQFLSAAWIDILRTINIECDVPVICYGLKTDFRGQLFESSRRLLEIADSIEEIKTICYFCTSKAIMNLKMIDRKPTLEGPSIELGAEEKYLPACWDCYFSAVRKEYQHECCSETEST